MCSPGSWHLAAAARDNRTFAIAGWTGSTNPSIRFFLVHLDENGRPEQPVALTPADPDDLTLVHDLAVSADGTRLAYSTSLIGGGATISVLDVATGRRRDWKTMTHPMVSGLSWAPDGRSLRELQRHIDLADLSRRPQADDVTDADHHRHRRSPAFPLSPAADAQGGVNAGLAAAKDQVAGRRALMPTDTAARRTPLPALSRPRQPGTACARVSRGGRAPSAWWSPVGPHPLGSPPRNCYGVRPVVAA
ncbi:hypothetical protein GCM10022226_77810 [Sphaerisporangium flaviroseum]|uniref:Dipeptidylpeptidase IV N-terminal domain-containing protein n=1 Tax=Sphaerisporangium flaviroseum TaxID=509199 RepID=A0ABP7JEZ1_9ACTN